MFERAGKKKNNNQHWQLWQQDNHTIELYNVEILEQKLNYLQQNPISSGFVDNARDCLYSSVRDYEEEKGLLEVQFL